MKALVIAEKPSVARDIARVLKCGKKINGAETKISRSRFAPGNGMSV